jgi:hypothetical protein
MLELFGARRDVYAKYWENAATGKKGYSPAYANDRGMGAVGRHAIPLDERIIEGDLRGLQDIGVYALRPDDSCIFLAADFDGDEWKENVLAYKDAAARAGASVAIERSRSGIGAHAWIFFAEPVPAARARRFIGLKVALGRSEAKQSERKSTADSRAAKDLCFLPRHR